MSEYHFGRGVAAALGGAALLLAACSGDSVTTTSRATAPTAVATPLGVDDLGQKVTLEVVDAGEIVGLITDHRGFAVYGNSGDAPPTFACLDDCTDVWVPLVPREVPVAARLDPSLYGVVDRPDSDEQQVTYRGIALYTWTGDRKVGVPDGAGVAGTWFALTADLG